jgi:FtsH-binding integral membrane protein
MTEETKGHHPADSNGDGRVSDEEHKMYMEFKRKELEDADQRRDAMRNMAWFALFGMLLYPFAVVVAALIGLEQAGKILGDMAPTYFVSVAAIVAAFFAGNAYSDNKKK